jgi:hypothetical protein
MMKKRSFVIGIIIVVAITLIGFYLHYYYVSKSTPSINNTNEAKAIQILQNSECSEYPIIYSNSEQPFHNDTETWEIPINVSKYHPACEAWCLINLTSNMAEIDWACTGAIFP